MIRIVSVGDIMPGGILSITDSQFVTKDIKDLLSKGDLRIGNFECAIEVPNPSGKKYEAGGNTIFIREKDAHRVKDLNIDIVSIANNHIFDLGPDGAYKAIEVLDRLGIKHCGAGRNLAEASKPVVLERGGKTYAFIAFSDTRLKYMYEASETQSGVNPLHEEYVIGEIEKYKQLYDYVIAIPHWGLESTYFPTIEVERLAKKMINSGASLVLGSHTHKIQPVVNLKKASIVFSMGNFLFANRIINKPRYTYYPDSPIDLQTLPTVVGCPIVDRPTIKLWKPLSYIGMITSSSIEDGFIDSTYTLTYMDMNNCVDVLRAGVNKQKLILSSIGIVIKCNLYGVIVYIGKGINRVKRFLKRK